MNAPSTEMTFTQAVAQFDGQVARVAQQLAAALPSHISIEKFQRTLMAAVKADPDLLRADRASLINACEKAALDGLLPDKREAALVVFKRNYKDASGGWQQALDVAYMPMVYGLRKKILQSNEVTDIKAAIVYKREVEEGYFIYEEGTEAMLRHKPMLDLAPEDATDDKIVAAYSMATYKDGSKSYEVMRRFEIDKVRESSQTGATKDKKGQPRKSSGPWVDWYPEQAKKTVMRRHSKTLPMSGDLIIDVEARELDAARSAATLLSVAADKPVAIPGRDDDGAPALEDQSGTEAGTPLNVDTDTGEVLDRDPATGRTVEDEETARALDAGQSDPEPEPEQSQQEPTWKAFARKVEDLIGKATDRATWEAAENEFTKVAGGMPDEEADRLDDMLAAKKAELVRQLENATQAG